MPLDSTSRLSAPPATPRAPPARHVDTPNASSPAQFAPPPHHPPCAQALYATAAADSRVKLADFEFGRIADGGVMRTMCGSPTFVAPEVNAGKVHQPRGARPAAPSRLQQPGSLPQQPGSHYERTGRASRQAASSRGLTPPPSPSRWAALCHQMADPLPPRWPRLSSLVPPSTPSWPASSRERGLGSAAGRE